MVTTRRGKDTANSNPEETPGLAARTSAPAPTTNAKEKDRTAIVASGSREENQQANVDPTLTNTLEDTLLWSTVTKGKHATSPKEQPKTPTDPMPKNPHTNNMFSVLQETDAPC